MPEFQGSREVNYSYVFLFIHTGFERADAGSAFLHKIRVFSVEFTGIRRSLYQWKPNHHQPIGNNRW